MTFYKLYSQFHFLNGKPNPAARAIRTGEFRPPKEGEWYISGAIPEAYLAPNDLKTSFHIARLVEIETKTVITESIIRNLDNRGTPQPESE